MKYPKVPKAGPHIRLAIVLTLLVIVFLYFINPPLVVEPATTRFLDRAGAAIALVGVALGAFGIGWSKENKQKLFLAQREIVTCTEMAQRLQASPPTPVIAAELARLQERKDAASLAMAEAAGFEQTAGSVSLAALSFVVVATLLQAITA